MAVDALHPAFALIKEYLLHARSEELEVEQWWGGFGRGQLRRRSRRAHPLGHDLPLRIRLRLEELSAHVEGGASRLHGKRLAQQPASLGLAGNDQTRNDLEVHPGLLFRPKHSAVLALLQRLQLERRAAVHMARGARRHSRTVPAAGRDEDRFDSGSVLFETQTLLARGRNGGDREHGRRNRDRSYQAPRGHRITAVWFRFGTCPTVIRAISFMARVSMTDTLFEPALALYK